jgi:hypothetical protein
MKSFFNARGMRLFHRAKSSIAGRAARQQRLIESLESRVLLSVNYTTYDNSSVTTGLNAQETQLTPANVNTTDFGKQFATSVDGQVYAQPLLETGVTITAGPNTSPNVSGVHTVVYVATQHDSIYAIDTTSGAVLWQRSFLSLTSGQTPGTNINNTLGASSISTIPTSDSGSSDITPEIGITGTPVIDSANNRLFVVVPTKEQVNGVATWVQRLHAINLSDGTDVIAPYLVAATPSSGNDQTNIYVYGTGDGSTTDPINNTGRQVDLFNALRQNQRSGLSLVNGELYVEWSSHGDQPPYHGYLVAWDVSNLAGNGFVLKGVFNDTPNGGEGGIWQGAGTPVFYNGAIFMEIGNGSGATGNFDANDFPTDGNYGQSVVKLVVDPTTSPTNQNINGWGFKVADYFTPYDADNDNNNDDDFSSGTALVASSIPNVPEVLVAATKDGSVFVINPNNMGKFSASGDNVLNAVFNGSHNVPPQVLSGGSFSTPAFFNGDIYWVSGTGGPLYQLKLNSDATFTVESTAPEGSLGYISGSTTVSASGVSYGIVWQIDRNSTVLRAYDANNLNSELWNSTEASGNADALDSSVKFAEPTVADGQVFVGTQDEIVAYGLNTTGAITSSSAATITGYAYDRGHTATPDHVQIVISGGPTPQTIVADLPSPELAGVLGNTSNDFSYTMPVLTAGVHNVSVYAISAQTSSRTLIGTATVTSQNSLFGEAYYLMEYPDVAAAVKAGQFATGYDHFIQYGQFEGRSPNPYWDETLYLQDNPDVAAAVKAGKISSGFMHYYQFGQYENRPGLLYFNPTYYLQNNADVAAAVTAGSVSSAFEHFVLYGQYENRAPMLYFKSSIYDADNSDILPFITGETFTSDFEHFILFGQFEHRIASAYYNESIYLSDNPDVAAAVRAGAFADGFQHWLEYGQYEGRTA